MAKLRGVPLARGIGRLGDLLPRPDKQILAALALIGPEDAEVGEGALPEIHGRSAESTCGHLRHYWTRVHKIWAPV